MSRYSECEDCGVVIDMDENNEGLCSVCATDRAECEAEMEADAEPERLCTSCRELAPKSSFFDSDGEESDRCLSCQCLSVQDEIDRGGF